MEIQRLQFQIYKFQKSFNLSPFTTTMRVTCSPGTVCKSSSHAGFQAGQAPPQASPRGQ